ncbi:MAG: hypothetical protein K2Y42_05285 [Hyphomicrobium sp.]|jgi:hypothetical protein|uniref:hypothetical protein n=1 Tax=Hyphomicrobium sp. TaxID=82 RepID=UPI0025B8DF98|nr:hypothetical protein [Hyphomicrobium sp.]MBX9862147.1 hypothetical protein [Hyphomicrobium sp.]
MSPYDLVLVVLVAAGAFYAGYQVGRLKALSERGEREPSYRPDTAQPLPGPSINRAPSDAGGSWADAGAPPGDRSPPPRRSSKPPPAAAGLKSE